MISESKVQKTARFLHGHRHIFVRISKIRQIVCCRYSLRPCYTRQISFGVTCNAILTCVHVNFSTSKTAPCFNQLSYKLRFMYGQSYFSGDLTTHTLKYVNKTSDFANNLYFSHNERRFHSEFYSRVKF